MCVAGKHFERNFGIIIMIFLSKNNIITEDIMVIYSRLSG